ncbi:MAG: DIP1984 family protein [Butyrivibrio sp.]|nr:DIP1984 family protein [Acetatifactor muris]MCM1558964.1 DIP1984 family protein [Butyrivibrio sp.]
MKLATALSERADLQKKLSELGTRLNQNAKVQEGEKPSEAPEELMQELDRIVGRLEELIAKINLTNSSTIHNGRTITELLAHRDCLKSRIQIMRSFLDNASSRINRLTHTEIKIKSTVPVSELQKKVDALSKELRECDELIQELNWTTELV